MREDDRGEDENPRICQDGEHSYPAASAISICLPPARKGRDAILTPYDEGCLLPHLDRQVSLSYDFMRSQRVLPAARDCYYYWEGVGAPTQEGRQAHEGEQGNEQAQDPTGEGLALMPLGVQQK